MKWNNQSAPSRIKLFSGFAVAIALSFSHSVWAAGTASGTVINNLAKLSYAVGGVAQNEICSSTAGNTTGNGIGNACAAGTNGAGNTAFTVDNKVNLTVTTVDSAAVSVVPGQANVVATFTVTNNGNTVQDYSLAGANLVATTAVFPGTVNNDTFDAGTCTAYAETAGGAGYQAASDTTTFLDEVLPDTTRTVYVVCTSIPSTQVNGDQANVSLTATTRAGGSAGGAVGAAVTETANTQNGVEIVFADPTTTANGTGTDPGQTARDAIGVARDAFKVVSAVLSVSKTVTPICDPFNGNSGQKNIPGAAVQYAITIVNTGSAAATLTTIADVLDTTNLTFNTDLISGAGVGANCVSGTGSLSGSGFGAVKGTGLSTSYAAPGVATQATTAGATFTSPNIAVNFSTLTTLAIPPGTASTLNGGDFITIYFNAFVK